jgi:mannose-1-phosphate guanylyltransferase / mannose-6-phosphate isomerase
MDRPEARAQGRSVPVILGGGGGTRLWPVSRDSCPKQFLRILSSTSSLQQAVLRVAAKDVFDRPIVMTIEPYRFLVRQQLEEIGCDAEIVIEPERRDSGPAILAAAMLVPPETVLFVSAADHLIEDRDGFLGDFRNAALAAEHGALVTFGIAPRRVTGAYGYIRPGEPLEQCPDVWRVARFVEKPGLAAAEQLMPKAACGTPAISFSAPIGWSTNMESSTRQLPPRFATALPRRNVIWVSYGSSARPSPLPGAARSTMR